MLGHRAAAGIQNTWRWVGFLLALVLPSSITAAGALAATITPFDPPGSIQTRALSINGTGSIAGYYGGNDGIFHGFVRSAAGAITTFDAPGSYGTYASSINSSGRITGRFLDAADMSHGFVRDSDGTITTFDPPGSHGTFPTQVNGPGAIVGNFLDSNFVSHGFIRSRGAIHVFDPPGSIATYVFGSNKSGYIVGSYLQSDHSDHGFLRNPDGTFVTFDPPDDQYGIGSASLNTSGAIAGTWFDETNKPGVFKRDLDGSIGEPVPVQACPSAPRKSCPAYANGINGHDVVAGSYIGEDAQLHGFASRIHNLAHNRGQTTLFDPSGSTGTSAMAINTRGVITGYYADASHTLHGFVLEP
jgi:hypothetical protein